MTIAEKLEKCIGCGAWVRETDGPTHEYIGASPGCWELYGQVLAKEYGEYGYPAVHRLTVDAYAVQHPGTPSRKSIQSVAGHLISLYCVLERGFDFAEATQALRRAVAQSEKFIWLEPPTSPGRLTIVDVNRARNLAEHEQAVHEWARVVWEAWSQHHEQIRWWAAR